MGILNTTPDSFSDGSQLGQADAGHFRIDLDKVLRRAETMHAEGAAILDVGGESTRPGAEPVSTDEELARVIPVIEVLRKNLDVCVSVDSSSPTVMTEAIKAGADIVNDVRALTKEGALQVLADSQAAICLMHMQGQPQTMQKDFQYGDVLAEVRDFLSARVAACRAAGIAQDRLIIDPGFGFGKSPEHNFRLLKLLQDFTTLGMPILVGISRKSMIGAATGRPVDERVTGSVAAATLALANGASIIRSHDVAATMDAIRVHCAYKNA